MANKKPVVFLFQDDKKRVDDWVLSYPENETGGQIFGLWTHDRNPHINVITGPGKNCTHGSHSFHQDINYLKDVGTFLNTQFMMCHIGEWHSHHKLRLRQPSSGDLNSIWKHFPSGVEHFLLIIATIESDGVRLNPWIFTASTHTYDAIDVEIIKKDNVFMLDDVVRHNIQNGEEKLVTQPQIKHHSSPQRKRRETQATHQMTTFNKNTKGPPWYDSEWGIGFAQLFHSKLEKIIDRSTEIKKGLQKGCVQFSFQKNKCYTVLTFPHDFPNSALQFSCLPPGAGSPIIHAVAIDGHSQACVEDLTRFIQDNVPTVHTQVAVKYFPMVK